MKRNLPKGLIFLAAIGVLCPFFAVFSAFISDKPVTHMIFFGCLLQGLSFQVVYLSTGLIEGIVGAGLFYLKHWAYIGFIAITGWNAFEIFINICITTNDTAVRTGWSSLHHFRITNSIVVLLAIVQIVWMTKYRKIFASSGNGFTANQAVER